MSTAAAREEAQRLIACRSYREVSDLFRWDSLWGFFDGDRDHLNIATECVDRHRGPRTAVRLYRAGDGPIEHSFEELSVWSSRFAHFLAERGVGKGDRVALMVEPSLEFYSALFGIIKKGAVAVPLFTLFGPDAVQARVQDCGARLLLVDPERRESGAGIAELEVVVLDSARMNEIAGYPSSYQPATSAKDLAVLQYTSGTSRQLPEAVPHSHRSIVTLVLAGLFGLGLKPDDRYFCPSSPAWGHGLWHGTIAPLSLGIAAGAYAGRFEAGELAEALRSFAITNLAAAGTVYRMLLRVPGPEAVPRLQKASYTGEALDASTLEELKIRLGTPVCGMYGTTETGVILANFPGFEDYPVIAGALGRPVPGWEVAVIDDAGQPVEPGVVGEIAVRRRDEWFRSKDRGRLDQDGYFWYLGRADDVIISAGWTISPLEIENVLLTHASVEEAAVIGIPDQLRGQTVKAFVVGRETGEGLAAELQQLVRSRLSAHEYPRNIEFVAELPKTANGKVNRSALRARVAQDVESV